MRIRTVKPEFWGDEKLSPLPISTRLIFLSLFSLADDLGRLLDSVPMITAFVFPQADDETFAELSRVTREDLATLSKLRRITRGTTANGQRIIQITHWARHQKIDKPSVKSALPEIVSLQEDNDGAARPSRDAREGLAETSRSDLGSRTYDQGPTTKDLAAAAGAHTRTREESDEIERSSQTTNGVDAEQSLLDRFQEPQRRPVRSLLDHVAPSKRYWLCQLLDGWLDGVGISTVHPIATDDVAQGVQEYLATAESTNAPAGYVAKHLRSFVESAAAGRAKSHGGAAPVIASAAPMHPDSVAQLRVLSDRIGQADSLPAPQLEAAS